MSYNQMLQISMLNIADNCQKMIEEELNDDS